MKLQVRLGLFYSGRINFFKDDADAYYVILGLTDIAGVFSLAMYVLDDKQSLHVF